MLRRNREPIIDLFKNYDLFDIGEFDDNANKIDELFEAYSIKQNVATSLLIKLTKSKNVLPILVTTNTDRMKSISEMFAIKFKNTI